ncbi:pentatricopeptide repeat-containing protein At4g02750 [Selaginella moellendorffii]|uniref:pentatricopeptide repeat-containing protein At4g02750 n=1 Tax=Selaginella moellendorffii TaxID=88036 RepID=UPI000D1CA48D|nr:pentatricopeptide repeat-containing protein At4g02750 [Selaginella moellendorffii]|eukprot:XP_024524476.1 pentatricopeptide repeat-containing protein At4g02750 [Selaginella moellendorffii]
MGIFRKKMGKPLSEEGRIKRAAIRLRRIYRLYGNPEAEVEALTTRLLEADNLLEVRTTYEIICTQTHTRDNRELKNVTIQAFGKWGGVEEARQVFDAIRHPRNEAYRAIFEAYVNNGHLEDARRVFSSLPRAKSSWWIQMMAAYARYGKVAEASEIYNWMPHKKALGWSLLLIAYARNGLVDEASEMLQSVPASDSIAANAVLAAFARAGNVVAAKELFDSMPARTSGSWNSLAQAYAQAGHLAECVKAANLMPETTRGTWVAMIRAYGDHGMVAEARTAFDNLPRVTVDACNTLIVAYARNGHLVEAKELFDAMLVRSTVTWASIMEACTMNNLAGQALEIFHWENCSGQLMPDQVVLSAVLSAHSWLGCLDDAAGIIRDMASDYGIRPRVEHYCAILAMLTSRSELGDAEDLAASMPFVAPASAWKLLLDVCKIRRDSARARRVAEEIVRLDPSGRAEPFMVVAGLYFREGRPQEAVDLMLEKGLAGQDVDLLTRG